MTAHRPKVPDESPGDVIAAYADGTIILDDGITTWNPRRAEEFMAKRNTSRPSMEEIDCLSRILRKARHRNVADAVLKGFMWACWPDWYKEASDEFLRERSA